MSDHVFTRVLGAGDRNHLKHLALKTPLRNRRDGPLKRGRARFADALRAALAGRPATACAACTLAKPCTPTLAVEGPGGLLTPVAAGDPLPADENLSLVVFAHARPAARASPVVEAAAASVVSHVAAAAASAVGEWLRDPLTARAAAGGAVAAALYAVDALVFEHQGGVALAAFVYPTLQSLRGL